MQPESTKSRPTLGVIIIGGILALCVLLLLMPSSRMARSTKAKTRLANDFVGPNDLSFLYSGFFVTSDNRSTPIKGTDEAHILVFAPQPKDSIFPEDFSELQNQYRVFNENRPYKAVCLLAPDSSRKGWSLFAKVWIGLTLQHRTNQQFSNTMATTLSNNAAEGMKGLNNYWTHMPPEIQAQAEVELERNRKVVAGKAGTFQYFQDGNRQTYEISRSRGIWEFWRTFDEAYPSPPSQ